MAAPILSNVGDIIIILGSVVPAGYLSLGEGTVVNRTEYADLWKWAQSNATVISESAWQRENTSYGTVAKFSSGNGSTTFRLPKIASILKAGALANAGKFNKAVFNDVHYHGLGKMRNNNGYWGRRSYSGATYPSGTTAWFWNGSGGLGGGTSSMETSGDVIVSYPIHVGATGNGEACDSLNVVCSIRAYHPGAVDLSTTMTLAEDDPETLSLTAATAMSVLTEDETVVADYGSVADEAGWLRETDGLQEVWGHTEAGDSATLTISYPLSFNNEIFYIDVHNQNGSKSNVTVVDFSLTSATLNLGANFEPTDIIEYRILGY